MKLYHTLQEVSVKSYNNFPVRVLMAIGSAHLIITHDEPQSLFVLLTLPAYYMALVINSMLSLIIIETVNYNTLKLDQTLPWVTYPIKRLSFQIIKGILLPLAMSMVFSISYFAFYGIHILKTVYFDQYFLIILLMIIILNFYYLAHFILVLLLAVADFKNKELASQQQVAAVKELEGTALIRSSANGCFLIKFDHEKLVWVKTIESTLQMVPSNQYFQVNRSVIVHIDNIKEMGATTSRRLKLTLEVPENEVVYVSQRQMSKFKAWYDDHRQKD